MNELIDTWGLYPWFKEDGEDLIHPDDIRHIEPNNTRVFHCIGITGDYLVLQSATYQIRVKPDNYKLLNKPIFQYKDTIIIKHQEKSGFIEDIEWHYKDNNYIYYINVEGIRKSKRYVDHEIIKII